MTEDNMISFILKNEKNTNPVRWITQTGDFDTKYTSKVEIVLT